MGRSNPVPSLRRSPGARFTTTRFEGSSTPMFRIAAATRVFASWTALPGEADEVVVRACPAPASTSTSTGIASTPRTIAERTRTSMHTRSAGRVPPERSPGARNGGRSREVGRRGGCERRPCGPWRGRRHLPRAPSVDAGVASVAPLYRSRMAIETRPLAFGGPAVSRLGVGLAALGRPAYITLGHGGDFPEGREPEAMQRRAQAVLDAALSAGITYVDVARSYGRAESFVRAWLDERRLLPGSVIVGSKWGYRYVGGWQLDAARHEEKDHSVEAFRRQLAESVGLLGRHLALYQIHSATPETGVLEDGPVLDGLAELRDAGVRVGVTVSGPRQAETVRHALAIRRGGTPLFAAVQATWNVLERSCEEALREARAAGRTVIVKEVLANGRLTDRGDAGRAGPLALLARDLHVGPDAVAIAAALARPWADVVLLGAGSVDQLRSNLRALEVRGGPALLSRLDGLRESPAAYWGARASLPWT